MPTEQPTTARKRRTVTVTLPVDPNPPHETVDQRIARVREGLEVIFGELMAAHDVITTVHKALVQQNVEQDSDFANVLQRCGSNKLFQQLEELSSVIEDLGGRTELTDDKEDDTTLDELVDKENDDE